MRAVVHHLVVRGGGGLLVDDVRGGWGGLGVDDGRLVGRVVDWLVGGGGCVVLAVVVSLVLMRVLGAVLDGVRGDGHLRLLLLRVSDVTVDDGGGCGDHSGSGCVRVVGGGIRVRVRVGVGWGVGVERASVLRQRRRSEV